MDRKNLIYFAIKLVILFSVFLGPIFVIISFISPVIPEYYYSWFITRTEIADYSSMGFILFFFVFLVCFKYSDKITNKITVTLSFVITGFILIYFALTPWLEIYLVLLIVSGGLFGIFLPIIYDFAVKNLFPEQESKINYILSILTFISLFVVSYALLGFLGLLYWRLLYVIFGCLMIAFSFYIAIFISQMEKKGI